MPKIETAELIFDPGIYPRKGIDNYNVIKLRRALEGGNKLPPVLICRSTKKIIDGVNRWTLAKERDEPTIDVELKDYANDAERFRDAAQLNAIHGMPLSRSDAVRVIDIGEALGLKEPDFAEMLQTTLTDVQKLRPRYARVSATEANGKFQKIPLKGSVRHLAGETVSPQQATALSSAPGPSYLLNVRQLGDAIRYRLLPPPDRHPVLWEELRVLHDLLEGVLVSSKD
jgi:hypothetical protein